MIELVFSHFSCSFAQFRVILSLKNRVLKTKASLIGKSLKNSIQQERQAQPKREKAVTDRETNWRTSFYCWNGMSHKGNQSHRQLFVVCVETSTTFTFFGNSAFENSVRKSTVINWIIFSKQNVLTWTCCNCFLKWKAQFVGCLKQNA